MKSDWMVPFDDLGNMMDTTKGRSVYEYKEKYEWTDELEFSGWRRDRPGSTPYTIWVSLRDKKVYYMSVGETFALIPSVFDGTICGKFSFRRYGGHNFRIERVGQGEY